MKPGLWKRLALAAMTGGMLLPPLGAFVAPEVTPAEFYKTLWDQSPFDRKTVPQQEEGPLSEYDLTGYFGIGQVRYATFVNRATQERLIASTHPVGAEQQLLSLTEDTNLKNVQARINVRGNEVAVKFGEAQLASRPGTGTAPPPQAAAQTQQAPVVRRVLAPPPKPQPGGTVIRRRVIPPSH
jgi:hypothetical protein